MTESWQIVRATDRERFVILDRSVVRNTALSFRARGVLAWILDQPPGVRINRHTLAEAGPEGKTAMESVLAELTKHGYIERRKVREDNGRVFTTTTVYEIPPEPGIPAPVTGAPKSAATGAPKPGSIQQENHSGIPIAASAANDDGALFSAPPANRSTNEKHTPSPRRRDHLFDAIAEVCGISLDGLTKSAASVIGKAKKELVEADPGVTPEEIHARAKVYRRRYRNGVTLTPTALIKHWPQLHEEKAANGPMNYWFSEE